MAAILRVKRRNEVEPLSALVVATKRRKTAEDGAEELASFLPLKAVVKFAGTVQNQEDDVEHLVKTLEKDKLKLSYKQHCVDIINKTREKVKQASIENRYKVVNYFRSLDTLNAKELQDKVMTVIDVEDSISCSIPEAVSTKQSDDYVYDIYYGDTGNIDVDDSISVRMLDEEMLTFGDIGESDECESEDSNSESNVRNDYPDTDNSEGSINDDDMRNTVQNMKLDDSSDLSSEDNFVYAMDERDVDEYGYKYAKYKVKVKKELGEDGSDDSYSSDHTGVCSDVDGSRNSDDNDE